MKITQLEIENVKRIKAVSITFKDNVLVLGGANGQGKSSTIDALEMALGGRKSIPSEPIRKGAKKARVVVEFEDLVVTRKFTAKGSTLIVESKDGRRYSSPQQMLDKLVGRLSFDPLAFVRMPAKEQADTLRELVGLDLSKLDAERSEAYSKRTSVNSEVRRLEGALAKMPRFDGGPREETSVGDLMAELERRMEVNEANRVRWRQVEALRSRANKLVDDIAATEKRLVHMKTELEALRIDGRKLAEEAEQTKDENVQEIRDQLGDLEEHNRQARANTAWAERRKDLMDAEAESERLSDAIAKIDESKAEAIAKAKYPVEGLAMTEEGVTLNEMPFAQASQAEQLKASVAIGLAMNPKLPLLLIRDGSLLDDKSLAAVAQMAKDADAQIVIERVGRGPEMSLIIEDGGVLELSAA